MLADTDAYNRAMKILCLALLSVPLAAFAGSGLPDRPYIYVSGYAEVERAPDTLTENSGWKTR